MNTCICSFSAQTAVDKINASSGKPGSSQHHPKSSGADGQDDHSAAESMLATQNDMLNTVTQLLQNTNSVGWDSLSFTFSWFQEFIS